MKLVHYFALLCAVVLVLSACGNDSAKTNANAAGENRTLSIKLAHVTNDQSAIHKGSIKFKELVEKESNGKMKVEVIPGGQLGSEKDLVESTKLGTVDITIPSAAVLSNFVPKVAVLTLPYVIKGSNEAEKYESLKKLSGSEVFKEIEKDTDAVGLKLFPEAVWWVGDRHVTTKDKPIKTLADLKGVKIRTPDAAAHTEPFKVLGANVTAMNITEVYYSLKTGALEAQENSINQIYTNKFHEVQKYVNLTGHMTQNELPVLNKQWWDGLSKDQQSIIEKAMFDAGVYMSDLQLKQNEEELKILQDNGMEVVETNLEEFKEVTKDLYKSFGNAIDEDFYNKIAESQ
ncbi:TRAP transporter substrate-binding protein [Metabacillus arenae]|uniref:TRAP transporter substrate-binding protein n=1 Tax=Metabacillus arenae TaxID=2771434 RepID=A0A926NH34_9BACI|nr:TRAP transporter substrate-binding protein [Metabacillus arenae]MBD1383339.1 TRAP transporter substrate-binding protein [Metabacillus arenae]